MKHLPSEIILNILQLLTCSNDRLSFAATSKWIWLCCCVLEVESHHLGKTIDALEFNQLQHLVIQDLSYKPSLLKHALKAPNLKSISFDDGQVFTLRFMAMIIAYIGRDKEIVIQVPKNAIKRFKQTLMIDDITNITLREGTDDDEIDDREVKRVKSDAMNLPALTQLYNPKEYEVYESSFVSDPSMKKGRQLSTEEADLTVQKYAPRFLESMLVMGGHWFFLTGYSVFLHQKEVDDLADKSKYGHQSTAIGFIRRKTRSGSDSFEFTIRLGLLELMAVSGFYGKCDRETNAYTPFLGSALKLELGSSLTESVETVYTRDIFIKKNPVAAYQRYRSVNQYFKRDSNKKWEFISETFQKREFISQNSLSLTSKENIFHQAAVFLLKSFALKEYDEKKISDIIQRLNQQSKKRNKTQQKLYSFLIEFEKKGSVLFWATKQEKTAIKDSLLTIHYQILVPAINSKNYSTICRIKEHYGPNLNKSSNV